MDIRPAELTDRERIEAIARDSFQSSYSLSPQEIEAILETEFGEETLGERLDDPDTVVLVADRTDGETADVLGFIDVAIGTEATIRWLHVDPEARGENIATRLVDRAREDAAMPLAAHILKAAVEGGTFLEDFGLTEDGTDRKMIGGSEFTVTVFTEGEGTDTHTPNEPEVHIPDSISVNGRDRSVDRDETIPGREAPFFPIYTDDEQDDPYGYVCSQCGSTNVSADSLDRLECGDCGNVHLADEWDDAYL